MEQPIEPKKEVWSNVNVAEVLPGVNPPLVISVVTAFFGEFVNNIFNTPKDVKVIKPIKGRLYFNVTLIQKELARIFGNNSVSFTSMFGGNAKTSEILSQTNLKGKIKLGWFGLRLALSSFFVQREFSKAIKKIDEDAKNFNVRISQANTLEGLLKIENELFGFINLMFTKGLKSLMLPFGNYFTFVSLVRKYFPPSYNANQFLANGGRNIQIVQSFSDLWRVAQEIKKRPDVEKAFLEGDPQGELLTKIHANLEINDLYQNWMAKYGYRSIKELDFSLPRWQEDPTFIIEMIKKYLTLSEEQNPSQKQELIISKRDELIEDSQRRLSYFQYRKFIKLLHKTEDIQAKREEAKSELVKLLASLRKLYLKVGNILIEANYYDNPADVFMFFREEIIKLDSTNLEKNKDNYRQVLEKRRQDYENFEKLELPDTIFDINNIKVEASQINEQNSLKGIGASSGVVSGTARVINNVSEINRIKAGEILVTDHTDPCWTPAFVIIGGVITNIGGPLSHASIVAREYGLPAVVNIPKATQIIKDGQRIKMDGSLGMVEILE